MGGNLAAGASNGLVVIMGDLLGNDTGDFSATGVPTSGLSVDSV